MLSGLFCFMSPNQLAAPTAQATTLPMHKTASIATEAETNASRTHLSRSFSAKRHNVHTLRYP